MTIPFIDSEYKPLRSILLHCPGPEIDFIENPAEMLFNSQVSYRKLHEEFEQVRATYRHFGIRVFLISDGRADLPNMMFCRDLFFMSSAGAVMACMASQVRKDEVGYATDALAENAFPLVGTIAASARFEGADALWLSSKEIVVGVGARTDRAAFQQLADILVDQRVGTIEVPFESRWTQHLLGLIQIVDRNMVVIRSEIIDPSIVDLLIDRGFQIVCLLESQEIRERQAMNFVTIAPRTIIMAAHCPKTRHELERAGIVIAAEVEIDQYINAAGGLACATGILQRDI